MGVGGRGRTPGGPVSQSALPLHVGGLAPHLPSLFCFMSTFFRHPHCTDSRNHVTLETETFLETFWSRSLILQVRELAQ